jgi:tRNA threonylcarbamoyladenosine biosynthesis protein TsaB
MTDAAVKINAMPLVLAAETSGRFGSVALALGPQLLGIQAFTGRMRHSAELFPAIISLLDRFGKKPNQIEQVYISVGPGSFTGLRIAVTLAKTMALANQAKIVAVDTLDCIAANVINLTTVTSPPQLKTQNSKLKTNECLAVILDAKRSQFFIAVYEKTQDTRPKTQDLTWRKVLPDCLMTADEFLDRFAGCGKRVALLGEGLVYYKDKFSDSAVRLLDEKYWNPSAGKVYELGWQKAQKGEFADPVALIPNYLRQPDVKLKNA